MTKTKIYHKSGFWLVVAVLVFLANQLPFIVDMRPVMYDEAWYGSVGYNLTQGKGLANTVVGYGGNANFLLAVLTSVMMRIFGYNLLSIRLTAVFCGVVTLFFLWLTAKQMRVGLKSIAVTFFFFVSCPLYNTIFRFGRPECAAIMCVAGGVYYYLRYCDTGRWKDILLMSLFAGLAFFAHPYSILLFAIFGIILFVQNCLDKNWAGMIKLSVLLATALLAIVVVVILSSRYGSSTEKTMDRFSWSNIALALPSYLKVFFLSKYVVYIVPLFAVILHAVFFSKSFRGLALAVLAYFLVFPFLFSTDLEMIDLGQDYFVYCATILLLPFVQSFKKSKIIMFVAIVGCVALMGMSYYYNYFVKYERTNSVMAKELKDVVEEGSVVFGPLRQWPMLMETDYQSDHSIFPVNRDYDYIIINSQDAYISKFVTYSEILPIDESKYSVVYNRETNQYGSVVVYKCNHK